MSSMRRPSCSHERVQCSSKPRLRGHLIFDQSAAGSQQLSEIMNIFAFNDLRRQVKHNAHARQHSGVDAISLCQSSDCLRKAPRLLWIDFDERQPRQTQMPLKPPVIGAGRLEDDENVFLLSQPGAQLPETFRRIGQAARLRPGMPECVKTVFRHVNAELVSEHVV